MQKAGKKQKNNLGKSLIRDRFGPTRHRKNNEESFLHTADLNDGYDWGRLNLQSVTEESSFQEFLSTAELAGTEFQAEKLNIQFVNPKSCIGLLTKEERENLLVSQKKHKDFLKIPRRPKWDENTTAQELQTKEKEDFLNWRRQLVRFQESQDLLMTPYEKNLEFWRQLWRVIERSDVIAQIVDARNPLLFRCEDLECYVKETNPSKMNMILVNKADLLTEEQRQIWADYFASIGVYVAFFSATQAAEKISTIQEKDEEEDKDSEVIEKVEEPQKTEKLVSEPLKNDSKLLSREELIQLLKTIYHGKTFTEGVTTIGLVGYPNVGKSSTINALMMDKKVSVSATPGKTKHFQTLFLDKDLLLCDCPGLVMPSFICTKAEMILNGILPIDQMRDHVPAVTLLATLIPRHVIEGIYGIRIAKPLEGEDPERAPTSEELLNSYGYNRGFMTQNGQPDNARSARYVLKDFVNGKLLYCVAPPNHPQDTFHRFPDRQKMLSHLVAEEHLPSRTLRAMKGSVTTSQDVDQAFFKSNTQGVHIKGKGKMCIGGTTTTEAEVGSKPWKKINKHHNKNKHEKARKRYAHLDQH